MIEIIIAAAVAAAIGAVCSRRYHSTYTATVGLCCGLIVSPWLGVTDSPPDRVAPIHRVTVTPSDDHTVKPFYGAAVGLPDDSTVKQWDLATVVAERGGDPLYLRSPNKMKYHSAAHPCRHVKTIRHPQPFWSREEMPPQLTPCQECFPPKVATR